MELAIGIDLGTTHARMGIYRKDGLEIICDEEGRMLAPSWGALEPAAFPETNFSIEAAAQFRAPERKNTVHDCKRLIGRSFEDAEAQADLRRWPSKALDERARPVLGLDWHGGTKQCTPEDIFSLMIERVLKIAEARLHGKVTKAVITVPASFSCAQRQAVRAAGLNAGLKDLRLMNEPTAAVVAHCLHRQEEKRNMLVYDLGGGTFDVSVFKVDCGFFHVKATAGSLSLGGMAFDDKLVDYCSQKFFAKHQTCLIDNPRAMYLLRAACERAKCALSFNPKVDIAIPALHEGINFNISITRARFERICQDLFAKTMQMVKQVLREADIDKESVNEVLLIGGSANIPEIRKRIYGFFPHDKVRPVNADDVLTTYGAAVQAAILYSEPCETFSSILTFEIAPKPIYIELFGGISTTVIRRNGDIPAEVSETFTVPCSSTDVIIRAYEGEPSAGESRQLLATLELPGVQLDATVVRRIKITVEIDASYILQISASELSSDQVYQITNLVDSNPVPQTGDRASAEDGDGERIEAASS